MDINNLFNETILPWLTTSGLRVLGIIIIAYLLKKFSGKFIEKIIRKVIVSDKTASEDAEKKREDTLIKITNATLSVIIILVAFLMILEEFHVEVGPILAAAGIVGVAFGFGAQYLVRDVISGLFLILENQYRVGDVVCFGDKCGTVEDITLRITTFRDLDGTVHYIPHGEIKLVSNLSKNFARVNLNIGVAYDADLEHVANVIDRVGEELAQEEYWKDLITKAPAFLRVQEFADSSVLLKVLGETKPNKQWEVAGELRRRIKIAFDKEGIEIPFPQRVFIQKGE
jgi:small-conductance mechanosensitive channel